MIRKPSARVVILLVTGAMAAGGLAAAGAIANTAASAQSTPPGVVVSGTVTDANGNPLAGATVATSSTTPGAAAVAPTTTDSTGAYTLSGFTPGDQYTVSVTDTGYVANSTVTEFPTYSSFFLPPIALTAITFSGTVTSVTAGSPIAGTAVELIDSSASVVETTTTDASGDYYFTTTGGPYIIYFTGSCAGTDAPVQNTTGGSAPCYVPQYYGGATATTATPVSSNSAPVSGLNAALTAVAFSGHIADAETGQAIAGAAVTLLTPAGAPVQTTTTDATGDYYLTAAGGDYLVYVPRFCSATSCYLPEYYNGVVSPGGAAVLQATGAADQLSPIALWHAVGAQPAWLQIVNYWRRAADLEPVSNEPAWDQGIKNHLIYLARTPAGLMTGQYASKHTENPRSPYYTTSGAGEAGSSDLDEGNTGNAAIDAWLGAPFHAIGMLRPRLTQVAFYSYDRNSGLDVISGLTAPTSPTVPVLFPGPGSTTSLLAYTGEVPDPLQTCGWSDSSRGLPLIVLLPAAPARDLSATLSGPGGVQSTTNRRLCLVDEYTYRSTDQVYGPTGRAILVGDNAVILIASVELRRGRYSVQVSQPGQAAISWSFNAR